MERVVDDRVSHDVRRWCAEQVIRMHTYGMDGPTGRCKTCTEDGCVNLQEAKQVLAINLVEEQP